MSVSAVAFTGYNGSENQPHTLGELNTSTSSVLTTNGTDWSSKVEVKGRNPNITIDEEISNVSLAENMADFSGYIQIPDPCHKIEQKVTKEKDQRYRLELNTVKENNSGKCIQQAVIANYRVKFQAGSPFKLDIYYGNKSVKELEHPDYNDGQQDPEITPPENSKGPITKLVEWITDFFSDDPKVKTVESEDIKGEKLDYENIEIKPAR